MPLRPYWALGATCVRLAFAAGAKLLSTSTGNFIAWRLSVAFNNPWIADYVVWYDSQAPHMLLRYEDGTVVYVGGGGIKRTPLPPQERSANRRKEVVVVLKVRLARVDGAVA